MEAYSCISNRKSSEAVAFFHSKIPNDLPAYSKVLQFVKDEDEKILNWIFRTNTLTAAKKHLLLRRILRAIFAYDDWKSLEFLCMKKYIVSFHSDSDGSLWITTDNGIFVGISMFYTLLKTRARMIHGYLTNELDLYIYIPAEAKADELLRYGKFLESSQYAWTKK